MTTTATSTLSRFPVAAADFVRDLYVEHLEEASFLYDQRNYMLAHPEFEASDIAWNEQRCDRQLDALVAGGEIALNMCKEQAASGDGGELYAALRVFCRAARSELVKSLLDELDVNDLQAIAAARDGLREESAQSLSEEAAEWLERAERARAAAQVAAGGMSNGNR